jgi:hypothetical protein
MASNSYSFVVVVVVVVTWNRHSFDLHKQTSLESKLLDEFPKVYS